MRYCDICKTKTGRLIKRSHKYMCTSCYAKDRAGVKYYDKPDYGEVRYSPEGKPICHICGGAYDKLLSHVWQSHKIKAYDYKIEFGLDTTKGIMSKSSKELARQRLEENYEIAVEENLIEKGKDTRFKEGSEGRTKDQMSEQTLRAFKNRDKKRGG